MLDYIKLRKLSLKLGFLRQFPDNNNYSFNQWRIDLPWHTKKDINKYKLHLSPHAPLPLVLFNSLILFKKIHTRVHKHKVHAYKV